MPATAAIEYVNDTPDPWSISSVLNVPTTSEPAASLMALELRLMAVGAAFDAAVSTLVLSLKSILPEPAVATSASVAVLT